MNFRFVAILAVAFALGAKAASAQPVLPPEPPPPPAPAPSAAATVAPAPPAPPLSPSLPPAGVIPATLSLDVTGSPAADPAFLDAQIRDALDRAIRPTLRPGASIEYGPIAPWPLFPLAAGARANVNVTVRITGDTATSADATAVTTVTLNSVDVAPAAPSVLFLSDDPEYLRSEGLIFHSSVAVGSAARLYYYHSDIGIPRDLDVVLTATVPSRVHLLATASGPELDVMDVGHTVTRDFLRFQQNKEGMVVDVVPGAPFVVRHTLILQSEVAAGAVDVHVVSGGPVAVSVVASPAGGRPEAYLNGPRVGYDGNRRHGVFDLAGWGAITRTYTVGGPPAVVQYGTRALTLRNLDPSDPGRDYGDYGVVHRITFTLANPTDDARPVYIYEKPLGGPLRSSFIVDGQFKELDCVRVPQPYLIATYQLVPHSTGASTTVTMTDGGSFYPVEFGVTDTPPVGTTGNCAPSASPSSDAAAPNVRS